METAASDPVVAEGSCARGDGFRRYAALALLVLVLAVPLTWGIFAQAGYLWSAIARMQGLAFFGASLLLGAILAIMPILVLAALLLAVWYGGESVFRPRSRATPWLDRVIVACSLLIWFSPALALLVQAGRAVAFGVIRFSYPKREYFLSSDPVAFWESIGYQLIAAGVLVFLAGRYWWQKFHRP